MEALVFALVGKLLVFVLIVIVLALVGLFALVKKVL
jgi:hypothetical protein